MPEFLSFSEFADSITEARIDMGFHFRSACGLGQFVGDAVAYAIVTTTLLPRQVQSANVLPARGRSRATP